MSIDKRVDEMVELSKEIHGELEKTIYPLLADRGPEAQGGVLADLLATWLAGHPAESRETILELTVMAVQALIPVNEAIMQSRIQEAGHG